MDQILNPTHRLVRPVSRPIARASHSDTSASSSMPVARLSHVVLFLMALVAVAIFLFSSHSAAVEETFFPRRVSSDAVASTERAGSTPRLPAASVAPVVATSSGAADDAADRPVTSFSDGRLMARRLRIQRIVLGLDRVGEAAMQMRPEESDRLEPILQDLEDRAVGLSDRHEIERASTDEELTQIEVSLRRLSGVVSKMIEPEMSL